MGAEVVEDPKGRRIQRCAKFWDCPPAGPGHREHGVAASCVGS